MPDHLQQRLDSISF